MSELIEAVRKMTASLIKPAVIIGKVKAFDESTWSITVELNRGGKIDQVTITSKMDIGSTGIFVEPVIDSVVLCGVVEGRIENLCVLKYSEVVRIKLMCEDSIELMGNNEGGLVTSSKVHSEIKQVKDELNELKQLFGQWVPVAQDGGAALKAQLSGWVQPLPIASKEDFENEKVKHGN